MQAQKGAPLLLMSDWKMSFKLILQGWYQELVNARSHCPPRAQVKVNRPKLKRTKGLTNYNKHQFF